MQSREPSAAAGKAGGEEGRLTYLDQALWKRLALDQAGDPDLDAWLTLQCGMIDGAVSAVLVLGPADVGPFKPACQWPADRPVRFTPSASSVHWTRPPTMCPRSVG